MIKQVVDKCKNNIKMSAALLAVLLIAVIGYAVIVRSFLVGSILHSGSRLIAVSILYLIMTVLYLVRIYRGNPFVIVEKASLEVVYLLVVPMVALIMEEQIYNIQWRMLTAKGIAISYVIVLIITLCLVLLVKAPSVAYIAVMAFNLLYGLVNHYVFMFKGAPPLYGEILGAKTGISVMGNYSYSLSDSIVYGCFIFALTVLVIICLKPAALFDFNRNIKKNIFYYIVVVLIDVLLITGLVKFDIGDHFDIRLSDFSPEVNFYNNGAPASMLLSIQRSKMKKSGSYSETAIKERLDKYSHDNETGNNSIKPTVIVIMNEAFSDLKALGDFESEEYLPYWNNMTDYVVRGNAYVSAYGSNTCNSEFEFLTGSTMSSLSQGTSAYQYFELSKAFCWPKVYEEYGYTTIAYHPFRPGNWNRIKVYDSFGFDKYYSENDMTDYEKRYVGNLLSDETDYDFLTDIYEGLSEPAFIFNVTLQNHSSYNKPLEEDIELISVEQKYENCSELINYLSLIKESDRAFEELIHYFEQVDEPVIICMYGDHQPSAIEEEFFDSVWDTSGGEVAAYERKQITPYVIWANYDTKTKQIQMDTSLNYLGVMVAQLAGIDTEYGDYLMELREEIPLINSKGYQTKDGQWHSLDENNALLDEYRDIQYYELFENKN